MITMIRRPTAWVLLVLVGSGCYSWNEQRVDPVSYIVREAPGVIRVDVAGGTGTARYRVHGPTISNDSLRGTFMLYRDTWRPVESPGLPVDLIRQPFKIRRFSLGKTILLGLGVSATVLGVWAASVSYAMSHPR